MDEQLLEHMRAERWVEALVRVEELIVREGETDKLLGAKVKILHALGEDENALAVMRQIGAVPSVDEPVELRDPADSFDEAAAELAQLGSIEPGEAPPEGNPSAVLAVVMAVLAFGMAVFIAIAAGG